MESYVCRNIPTAQSYLDYQTFAWRLWMCLCSVVNHCPQIKRLYSTQCENRFGGGAIDMNWRVSGWPCSSYSPSRVAHQLQLPIATAFVIVSYPQASLNASAKSGPPRSDSSKASACYILDWYTNPAHATVLSSSVARHPQHMTPLRTCWINQVAHLRLCDAMQSCLWCRMCQ